MSRWNRSRTGSVAVPLDTLFRENTNCPSAARSAGTVGKWGITSFTSIRSAPYAFSSGAPAKKSVQDQNSPLTVPAVETELPPPKPKKFFKSRNDPPPPPPELILPPPQADYSRKDQSKTQPSRRNRGRSISDDDDDCPEIDIPRLKVEKPKAPKKATKVKKEETPSHSPIKRYLVRNRDKVINYAEDDEDNAPLRQPTPVTPPVVQAPKLSPIKLSPPKLSPPMASPTVKPGAPSPGVKDGKPPPIVLRISKGTSRIVSTDSNEGLTSPTSDRGSTYESHDETPLETGAEMKSPKHESLKITIKYNKEKKKKDKEESKSKALKRYHRKSGEEPPPRIQAMSPPSELAQPVPRTEEEVEESIEDIQSEIARINSESQDSMDDIPLDRLTEPAPEPKPPERSERGGRAMRSRASINYNENEEEITHKTKHKKENKKEKGKKRVDTNETPEVQEPVEEDDNLKLIEILSGAEKKDSEEPIKLRINRRNSIKPSPPQEQSEQEPQDLEKVEDSNADLDEGAVFKSPQNPTECSVEGDDKPSVKLVISKKKGSIFKSRSLVDEPSQLPARKRRHLYKHQWSDDAKGNQTPLHQPEVNTVVQGTVPDTEELDRVTRYKEDTFDEPEPYTSVMCPKSVKEYYTVVRNVKKAHQMQEIGEFQELNDDVEYILDALQDGNPMSTRCLSAITLASKCTAAAFRMHVRAHGTVQKFFSALHDAANDQSLGLCTATVMFVLSQDRLNMDLDRESLELMLNLLESDVSHKNALDDCGLTSIQLAKNKERVRELCAEIKSQGKAKDLDLDNITVGHLAMETLLSLTSKRAGEWFKEELRTLGGIEHIVRTIRECCNTLRGAWQNETIRKLDRCMRVLENVTQQNEENQVYLVSGCGGDVLDMLCWTLSTCSQRDELYVALPALKVLLNLSHASVNAAMVGGAPNLLDNCFVLLLNKDRLLPDDKDFEFSICVLLLLINLVQNSDENLVRLLELQVKMDSKDDIIENVKPALSVLVQLFYVRQELARLAEQNTDAILDGKKETEKDSSTANDKQDDIEETVAKLLQKAGTHMEHSMVGAYIALLLGEISQQGYESNIRALLKTNDYTDMLQVLRKYYSFLNLTASAEAASVAHVKSTQKIIKYLEECDTKTQEKSEQNSSGGEVVLEQQSDDNLYPSDLSYKSNSTSDYNDTPQDMSLHSINTSYGSNH